MHASSLVLSLSLAALACQPLAAQRLIACDSNRSVYELDINTGARTLLGTISSNAGTTGGLAYDQQNGRLYVTSTSLDSVFLLDVTNWNASLIGFYGDAAVVMHGIEWDPSTNTLYGMSSHNTGLYNISTTTGLATLIGTAGLTSFCNLGYDPTVDTMWMTNSNTDSFYSINRSTGAATLVGPLNGPTNPNGLAYNIDNLTLYLVDNSTDQLYTINTATGQATSVGSVGSSNLLGLVYIPGNGRMTRAQHGCGNTTIRMSGHPNTGFYVEATIGNATGIPFVGFGLSGLGVPFCGCTVGHDWVAAAQGASVPFNLPANPVFVGVQLYIQGMDFLGTGGCSNPQLTLTDTITVTIG